MGKQAAQLLEEFEALSPADKQTFVIEILRRTREFPLESGPLSDDEIGQAGKLLFALLDEEEDAAGSR